MMSKLLTLSLWLVPIIGYSQYDSSYEQIALDYFYSIVGSQQEYRKTKYFVLKRDSSNDYSSCCSFCLSEVSFLENVVSKRKDFHLDLTSHKRIVDKLSLFQRLFVRKGKKKHLFIFKPSFSVEHVLVVIQVSDAVSDDFITITIDRETNSVVDHCNKKFYS